MQNTNPIPLVVADVAIRTDAEGRYCLNDLHNAAGDLPKDQPAKYFANQQAKDLISEIGDHSVHVIRQDVNGRNHSPKSETAPWPRLRKPKTPEFGWFRSGYRQGPMNPGNRLSIRRLIRSGLPGCVDGW